MSDRVESIRKGFLILLPVLDEKGRAIIYSQPTLMGGEKEIVEEVSCLLMLICLSLSIED